MKDKAVSNPSESELKDSTRRILSDDLNTNITVQTEGISAQIRHSYQVLSDKEALKLEMPGSKVDAIKQLLSIPPLGSFLPLEKGDSTHVMQELNLAPFQSLPVTTINKDLPEIPSGSKPLDLDPVTLAKELFDETMENFSVGMVCPLIGKK